jgi:hypothetical protein
MLAGQLRAPTTCDRCAALLLLPAIEPSSGVSDTYLRLPTGQAHDVPPVLCSRLLYSSPLPVCCASPRAPTCVVVILSVYEQQRAVDLIRRPASADTMMQDPRGGQGSADGRGGGPTSALHGWQLDQPPSVLLFRCACGLSWCMQATARGTQSRVLGPVQRP